MHATLEAPSGNKSLQSELHFLKLVLQSSHSFALSCRLSQLAGEELSALQARNFSSSGDISAHASGVRVLVLRVLKAAVSLTKAKSSRQKDQVHLPALLRPFPFGLCLACSLALPLAVALYAFLTL